MRVDRFSTASAIEPLDTLLFTCPSATRSTPWFMRSGDNIKGKDFTSSDSCEEDAVFPVTLSVTKRVTLCIPGVAGGHPVVPIVLELIENPFGSPAADHV